jgi:hypothetical protein
MDAELARELSDRLLPPAALKATFALKAASYVFLIRESIPYLLLRYDRFIIHLYPLPSFGEWLILPS